MQSLYFLNPFKARFVSDLVINPEDRFSRDAAHLPGPGCSKLTTSLVNASLKFKT